MKPLPNNLEGWKALFFEAIEEARCAAISDDDRDELVAYLKREAEKTLAGPPPPARSPSVDRQDPWEDLGYWTRSESAPTEASFPTRQIDYADDDFSWLDEEVEDLDDRTPWTSSLSP